MEINRARKILADEAAGKSDEQIKEIVKICEIFSDLLFEQIDTEKLHVVNVR